MASWETTILGLGVIFVCGGLVLSGLIFDSKEVLEVGLGFLTTLSGLGLVFSRSQRQHEKDKKEGGV